MPIHRGVEKGKGFYQWGNEKKYFYKIGSDSSRKAARAKAVKQAQAIYASGYKK